MTTTQLLGLIAALLLLGGFVIFPDRRAISRTFRQHLTADDRAERLAKIPGWATAAASGDVGAQLTLAWEYARGDVVDYDIRTAWDWFERAAASGHEEARVHRARFLQLRGVPEGIRELRALAKTGNWKAQFWMRGTMNR
jgi:TPR repeat protein